MSEPVSQATLRIVKVFWGLSASLASKRHFPAIDWLTSYSLYGDRLSGWYTEHVAPDCNSYRAAAMRILQEEAQLDEIVRLVGMDALSPRDRLTMEAAKSVREDYLHQNAFHETDTYSSMEKQYKMLKLIIDYYRFGIEALEKSASLDDILSIPARDKIGRSKYVPEAELASVDAISADMKAQLGELKESDGF
jgi:V/A-type H+-transporting ATPase subunit A